MPPCAHTGSQTAAAPADPSLPRPADQAHVDGQRVLRVTAGGRWALWPSDHTAERRGAKQSSPTREPCSALTFGNETHECPRRNTVRSPWSPLGTCTGEALPSQGTAQAWGPLSPHSLSPHSCSSTPPSSHTSTAGAGPELRLPTGPQDGLDSLSGVTGPWCRTKPDG